MTIEKLSNDVQQIKDDLNKLRESVSSEEEKEKMMKEILDKANATKRELEKEIETFNDEKKEKAQALLDSLNEIINFELSLTMPQGQNNEEWWEWEQQVEWDQQNWESEENWREKKWLWRQREWLTSKQEWKDHTWKNILRALWWVWILWWTAWLAKKLFTPKDYESEIPWYSEMSRKEKRLARKELRRQKREERREERAERRAERKESRSQKSFWERPFGKVFKWTIIWTGVYYVSHGLTTWKWNPKDTFDWKKDNSENPDENNNTPENETPSNNTPNGEIPNNNTPEENEEPTPNPDNNSWEENAEVFEATNANTISNVAIQTLNQAKSFDKQTNDKVKATLNTYLQEHPMLKKSANGHMVFEIWDKRKFNNTLKQVWNDVLSWLNMIERWLAKALFGWKLDNIDSTMRGLNAKDYEYVVFKYLWWIVKETVKAENWSMTVQEFYNSIKKYYPSNNASTIENHLAQSGQANKDIKDMDIEKIVKA